MEAIPAALYALGAALRGVLFLHEQCSARPEPVAEASDDEAALDRPEGE
jgi:hypothetical protein